MEKMVFVKSGQIVVNAIDLECLIQAMEEYQLNAGKISDMSEWSEWLQEMIDYDRPEVA